MATDAVTVQPEVPKPEEPSVHLVARSPNEMQLATTGIALFLQQKIKQCDTESGELGDAAGVAATNGWKFDTLERHSKLAKQRGDFYRKVLAAVEAGYTIVPNFPIDLFAIRVRRTSPHRETSTSYSRDHAIRSSREQEPQILEAGEGRYVSPLTSGNVSQYQEQTTQGKEITKYSYSPTDFQEIAFPIEAARPEVMSAAAEAMALKCFDAIGICPQMRNGDPLIIGQILSRTRGFSRKTVSFLIAWHLDLRTL